jgi:hypothetical protein
MLVVLVGITARQPGGKTMTASLNRTQWTEKSLLTGLCPSALVYSGRKGGWFWGLGMYCSVLGGCSWLPEMHRWNSPEDRWAGNCRNKKGIPDLSMEVGIWKAGVPLATQSSRVSIEWIRELVRQGS